ncbi:MAG: ribosome maturation factor RimP [Myxococcota bacterium]|nr:ribosome maturation factor RimP [Myxococcota bacterium]
MYRDIPPRLCELIEPIVAGHGLELVDTEILRGPGGVLVRVVVDTPAGDGLVPVGRCAEVSREIGTSLDAEAHFPRGYRLEVASPGLDRVLAREKDFAAARGVEVKLETRRPLDGRRHFRGQLLAFEAGVARIGIDGREHLVPFEEIARARRVYHFTPADFSKSPKVAREAGETS